MLQAAAKLQTVSVKHLIDLSIQAGITVIIDGRVNSLSDLLLIKGGLFSVVSTTVDSITVKTQDESEAI